jgi:phenylalanyl-tRNA synthetase beta chain
MNISYNWLKELTEFDLSPDELAIRLTSVGLAVEGIHAFGDDFVFDIDLTSNRPDCLSHLGVAREIAVITKTETRAVGSVSSEFPGNSDSSRSNIVSIQEPDLCNRFTARIIRNVKIGPSPQWLVNRLEAIGERSINNVADITNYVMHDLGQPMHSFDLDKLSDSRIVVRRAKRGETIQTLDEVARELDESMLAICDAEKPIAVAGIMGGLDSSITDTTANVLLEVAFFKRENIRATSRKLNLTTEASYRFERGVDIEKLIAASDRAAGLINELAGGVAGEFIDVYPVKFGANEIVSRDISAAVKRLTGLVVDNSECRRVLDALGIEHRSDKIYLSPSWRYDLSIEEDLVEEVARHAGYDRIATELPPAFGAGEYQPTEKSERLLRQTLADMGFDEAISYSFINTASDDLFEPVPELIDEMSGEPFVTLQDSVIEGAVRMRPTVLPGLLDAVRHNLNHQRRDVKLFEIGKVFAARSGEDPLPNEQEVLAIVLTGGETNQNRAMPERDLDFYDAKGSMEAALDTAGVFHAEFIACDIKHLRPGQAAAIMVGGKRIGQLGRLSDTIGVKYKFKQAVYLGEINLQMALRFSGVTPGYRPLAKFPSVFRDVSFVTKRSMSFADIRAAIVEEPFDICRGIDFVDVYEGKGMSGDERSVTIRLLYRSDERTLVEEEVEAIHKQILSQIEQKLSINPRV